MRKFEDMVVWCEAQSLTLTIYSIMNRCKDCGFRDQIQRSAVSIMNNIAEGSESGLDSSFVRYLRIAKGSSAEVRSMLYLAKELSYCNDEQFEMLLDKSQHISAGISRLISYLNEKRTC